MTSDERRERTATAALETLASPARVCRFSTHPIDALESTLPVSSLIAHHSSLRSPSQPAHLHTRPLSMPHFAQSPRHRSSSLREGAPKWVSARAKCVVARAFHVIAGAKCVIVRALYVIARATCVIVSAFRVIAAAKQVIAASFEVIDGPTKGIDTPTPRPSPPKPRHPPRPSLQCHAPRVLPVSRDLVFRYARGRCSQPTRHEHRRYVL